MELFRISLTAVRLLPTFISQSVRKQYTRGNASFANSPGIKPSVSVY